MNQGDGVEFIILDSLFHASRQLCTGKVDARTL
jgi:hypothetical protein